MPGSESLPPEPQRSDLAPVLGLRGLATAALALPAVPAVAADRSPTSLILAAVAVGLGATAAWWISRRLGAPRLLLAVLGGLLVVVAGWLLPQADVSPITVLIGLGVGVGAGLGGGTPGILRRRQAAIGAAVGLVVLAALVGVDGRARDGLGRPRGRRGDRRSRRARSLTAPDPCAGLGAGGGGGGGGGDSRGDLLGGGELAHGDLVRFAGLARSA